MLIIRFLNCVSEFTSCFCKTTWEYSLRHLLSQGSPNYGPRAKCGPWSHFVSNEKKNLLKFRWFDRMYHIAKQSHYVSCPALELLCKSLCGPQTKKFGVPSFKLMLQSFKSEHGSRRNVGESPHLESIMAEKHVWHWCMGGEESMQQKWNT